MNCTGFRFFQFSTLCAALLLGHVFGLDFEVAADGRTLVRTTGAPESWRWPEASPFGVVMHMAEGVGSMTYDMYPTESRIMNAEMRRRMTIQDSVTLVVVLLAFVLTVGASLTSVYHVAADPSPVKFYTDAKGMQQRMTCPTGNVEAFLQAFNGQPSTARLRIIGSAARMTDASLLQLLQQLRLHDFGVVLRNRASAFVMSSVGRRSGRSQHFDVSLDLTPFINGDGRISSEDESILQAHLQSENPLEVLTVRKRVDWECWEDVATNVKQRLRCLGYVGDLQVTFEAVENLVVYRNDRWQNFTRNPITTALMMLSIVGLMAWLPYTMIRKRAVTVETRFTIVVDPSRYWELVNDRLSIIEGFEGARWGAMPPSLRFR